MNKKIRKVVIPAAGLGTRFLPATKAMPKEMLPVVDKPIIQYVIEEAVASGIEDIIIVTGWHKRSIEDHFDYPFELEKRLEEAGKFEAAEEVRRLADMANFIYVRQKGVYGNGTPILNARRLIGDEPFAVLWADEFMYANPPRLKQMLEVWDKYQSPAIAAVRFDDPKVLSRYGVLDATQKAENIYKINSIVEKPEPGTAPSNMATIGTYILPPRIFEILSETKPGKAGELWLNDAINTLMKESEILGVEVKGRWYDTGNKLEYLKAVVEFGLRHDDLKDEFGKYLKDFVSGL